MTIATHHGSHGFWRKTAWRRQQRAGHGGGALPPGILSWFRLRFMPRSCGPLHLRAAHLRLLDLDPAGAEEDVGLVDLRLVDARAVDARDLLARDFPRKPPPSSSASAAAASSAWASSPDFTATSSRRSTGRPIQIGLGGRRASSS